MVLSETFEISKFASFLDFYATGNYQNKFEAKKTFTLHAALVSKYFQISVLKIIS